jgi:hypothetical protein
VKVRVWRKRRQATLVRDDAHIRSLDREHPDVLLALGLPSQGVDEFVTVGDVDGDRRNPASSEYQETLYPPSAAAQMRQQRELMGLDTGRDIYGDGEPAQPGVIEALRRAYGARAVDHL